MTAPKRYAGPWKAKELEDGRWCVTDAAGRQVPGLKYLGRVDAERIARWASAEVVEWCPSSEALEG